MFIANKKRRRVAKLCFHGKNSGSVFLAFSLTPTQYPNLIELIRIKASNFFFFFGLSGLKFPWNWWSRLFLSLFPYFTELECKIKFTVVIYYRRIQ